MTDTVDVKKIMDSIKKKAQREQTQSMQDKILQHNDLKPILMERVIERKKSAKYLENKKYLQSYNEFASIESEFDNRELEHNLHKANLSVEINYVKPILSGRNKIIRRLALKIRHIIQNEIRFTLDPIIRNQVDYNSSVVRSLNEITKNIKNVNEILLNNKKLLSEHSQELQDNKKLLSEHSQELQDNKKNNEKLSKLETAFNDVRIQLMESELKRAYNLYLHREPNVEEIHNHLNAVLANQTTIDEIMNGITQSEELKYLEKLRSGYVIMKEGFALFLDAEDQVISKAICMTGVWEPKETELVKKIIKRGMYLVDVGANIGYYTTLFSRLTGDKGKVISFEPSPLSFSILDKNARMNCLKNVVIVQKALSNLTGIEKLYLSKTNPGDNRLSSSIVEETDKDRDIIEVEVVRLDDFYKEDRIDLLKIDVQGAEMKVIEGGLKTIENNPDMQIIIEFWPKGLLAQGVEPIQLLSKLEHLGFNLYDLNTDGVLQCYNSNELYQKYVDSSVNLYCTKKSIENLKLG